jgi:hypothetical protein
MRVLLEAVDSESVVGECFALLTDVRGVRTLRSEGALCGKSFALLTDLRGVRMCSEADASRVGACLV